MIFSLRIVATFALACLSFSVESASAQEHLQKERRADASLSTINDFDCYHDLTENVEWVKSLVQRYASSDTLKVQLEDIGDSWIKTKAESPSGSSPEVQELLKYLTGGKNMQGFDIYALSITAKPRTSSAAKIGEIRKDQLKTQSSMIEDMTFRTSINLQHQDSATPKKFPFLLLSSIHAREFTPPELIRRWLEHLLDRIDENDADYLSFLEHTEIHWIPYVNPDGRALAETTQLWRRKNLNIEWTGDINDSNSCSEDSFGVDLNRNLPFEWGNTKGSSRNPCSAAARGSAPGSEPETRALISYAERVFPSAQRDENAINASGGDYKVVYDDSKTLQSGSSTKWKGYNSLTTSGVFVDVHSYGSVYIYPWGNKNAISPNDVGFRSVIGNLQDMSVNEEAGPGPNFYGVASGATDDWAYGVLGALAMTWELGSSFHEACTLFEAEYQQHFESFKYLAKIAPFPFALGKGPVIKAIQDFPLSLTIYFQRHDDADSTTNYEITRVETEMGSNAGQNIQVDLHAYLPKVLPARFDPIEFDEGGTSHEPLGGSIESVRIYHRRNPLVYAPDASALSNIDESTYWNIPFEQDGNERYIGTISKDQLWEAFGIRDESNKLDESESRRLLYFQAMDDVGNWGPLTARSLDVVLVEETSSTPTQTPSTDPTSQPTASCRNNTNFRFKDKKRKNCAGFLRSKKPNKVKKRCKKWWKGERVYDWCPRTCGRKVGLGRCAFLQDLTDNGTLFT